MRTNRYLHYVALTALIAITVLFSLDCTPPGGDETTQSSGSESVVLPPDAEKIGLALQIEKLWSDEIDPEATAAVFMTAIECKLAEGGYRAVGVDSREEADVLELERLLVVRYAEEAYSESASGGKHEFTAVKTAATLQGWTRNSGDGPIVPLFAEWKSFEKGMSGHDETEREVRRLAKSVFSEYFPEVLPPILFLEGKAAAADSWSTSFRRTRDEYLTGEFPVAGNTLIVQPFVNIGGPDTVEWLTLVDIRSGEKKLDIDHASYIYDGDKIYVLAGGDVRTVDPVSVETEGYFYTATSNEPAEQAIKMWDGADTVYLLLRNSDTRPGGLKYKLIAMSKSKAEITWDTGWREYPTLVKGATGDNIYVHFQEDDFSSSRIAALESRTGAEIWAVQGSNLLAVSEKAVLTTTPDWNVVNAYDAVTGKHLWTEEDRPLDKARIVSGVAAITWNQIEGGTSFSSADTILISPIGSSQWLDSSHLVGLNIDTGDSAWLWRFVAEDWADDSMAASARAGLWWQITDEGSLKAIDFDTGATVWEYPLSSETGLDTPVIGHTVFDEAHDTLLMEAGYVKSATYHASSIIALNAGTGKEFWQFSGLPGSGGAQYGPEPEENDDTYGSVSTITRMPGIYDGMVLVEVVLQSDTPREYTPAVCALNIRSGDTVWTLPLSEQAYEFQQEAADAMYDGAETIVDVPTGKVVLVEKYIEVTQKNFGVFGLLSDMYFTRLRALDIASGEEKWNFGLPMGFDSYPTYVYRGINNNNMPAARDEKYRNLAGPGLSKGLLLRFYLEGETLYLAGTTRLGDYIFSDADLLLAVNAGTGHIDWYYRIDDPATKLTGQMWSSGDSIFFWTTDGSRNYRLHSITK